MIEDERPLDYAIEWLTRMYRSRDREASKPLGDPQTREDVLDGTVSVIRKIEQEVSEYLARKYALLPEPAEAAA